jgi:hypothetical protein
MKMWVRLLKDWQAIGAGSIINCSEMCGNFLIAQGIGVPTSNPEIAAPAPIRETAIKAPHETR